MGVDLQPPPDMILRPLRIQKFIEVLFVTAT